MTRLLAILALLLSALAGRAQLTLADTAFVARLFAASYPYSTALTNNLISWWKLDETGNNDPRVDSFGTNTLGNPVGFITQYTAGVVSNAAYYTIGNWSAGLKLDNPPTLILTNTSWTIATWVYPTDDGMGIAPPYSVGGKANAGTTQEYSIKIEANGTVRVHSFYQDEFDATQDGYVTSTNTITANQFNFIVGVFDLPTKTLSVSVNNSPFITSTAFYNSTRGDTTEFSLGIDYGDITYLLLDRYQDETAVWKRALFQTAGTNEVNYLYRDGQGRTLTGGTVQ